MGRIFNYDDRIDGYINTTISKYEWSIGCVVGQQTMQRDYVVLLPRTPVELNATSEQAGDSTNAMKVKAVGDVSPELICGHAEQVQSMLPGGLDVIGVYVIAPPAAIVNATAQLRQFVYAVHNVVSQEFKTDPPTAVTSERLLLQIDSLSHKVTCRTFDVSDTKATAKLADWKLGNFIDRWITLSTSVTVDTKVNVPVDLESKSLKRQLQTGLLPACQTIWTALATLNGSVYTNDEVLDSAQQTKRKRRETPDSPALRYDVDLYQQTTMINQPAMTSGSCCAKIYFRGTMSCRAYVHSRAIALEAIQAIKMDAIRTLLRRCELLCEDLLQSEEDQDAKVLYETPRRVFIPLRGTPVKMTDYIFPDETSNDCARRVQELLDIPVAEEDVDTQCEKLPADDELVKPQADVTATNVFEEVGPERYRPSCSSTGMLTIIGILLTGVALAFGYMYSVS